MSWPDLLTVIKSELDEPTAARVEARLLTDLAGVRITIPAPSTRRPLTDQQIDDALTQCGRNVELAARRLGVHHSTLYRRLSQRMARRQQVQATLPAGPMMNGKPLR